jgi:ankyrin repeat protein
LDAAAWADAVEAAELLADAGAPIERRSRFAGSEYDDAGPLQIAAAVGSFKTLKLLIRRGADVNASVGGGEGRFCNVLHSALARHSLDCARLLIESGCNLGNGYFGEDCLKEHPFRFALRLAVGKEREEALALAELMIPCGIALNGDDGSGERPPLYWAYETNETRLVRALLLTGADPNEEDLESYYYDVDEGPIQFVSRLARSDKDAALSILKLMCSLGLRLDEDPEPQPFFSKRRPSIFWAIESGDPRIIEAAIEAGASLQVSERPSDGHPGRTPLEVAGATGDAAIVAVIANHSPAVLPV